MFCYAVAFELLLEKEGGPSPGESSEVSPGVDNALVLYNQKRNDEELNQVSHFRF